MLDDKGPVRQTEKLVANAPDMRTMQGGVFDALIEASERFGASRSILEDQDRKPLSYRDLIRASFALGRRIARLTAPGEHVGLFLPTSSGAVVTFFALQAFARVPTMLNFTSGARNLKGAIEVAGVKTVLTSRRFIAQARLEELAGELGGVCRLVYLEDIRKAIGPLDRLYALAAGAAPRRFRKAVSPGDVGVILFTSGSFAAPRGVVLTQGGLVSNARQVATHIELDTDWVFFNPLPVFHSFGLTAGILTPILNGLKAFEYPSPLHTKIITGLIRDTGASVLLTTDTFLGQYMRAAAPGDLAGLIFAVCGAEKVREDTHRAFAEMAGGPVIEGYGATEAGPVIAVNHPSDNRPGTVGQFVPGVEARLEPVDGIKVGGRLHIRGPNIMAGYLNDNSGALEAPPDGWHDTGDIVSIDKDGYVRLLGRAKRFAKIGGEMISLSAVEDLAAAVWPERWRAVVAVADPRKGERLVLVLEGAPVEAQALLAHAQSVGAPEIAVPRKIVCVPTPVLLGTGKTDYAAVQRIAQAEA
jgi:acyl-[acyl-carrier-protein]-phospholipid O-acyltransferase/long-chain-fatty-acid--[acyl-carrier-protein] ligase